MLVRARGSFLRISPSKVRQVIDMLRQKDVTEAEAILANINKRPKEFLVKILKQAVANAKVKGLSSQQLFISKIICDVGPTWKRFKAAAFGRAASIKKRTSHITIELDMRDMGLGYTAPKVKTPVVARKIKAKAKEKGRK
ncbi:MAG: 50S ribosomal protein L22 [Candidatus Omnitrophota bacterium]